MRDLPLLTILNFILRETYGWDELPFVRYFISNKLNNIVALDITLQLLTKNHQTTARRGICQITEVGEFGCWNDIWWCTFFSWFPHRQNCASLYIQAARTSKHHFKSVDYLKRLLYLYLSWKIKTT